MFGKKKHKGLIWSVIISSVLISCQNQAIKGVEITGETQGTTYSIIIAEEDVVLEKKQIDSLLSVFDASLSTYIPSSVVSRLNEVVDSASIIDYSGFFYDCYTQSQHIFKLTNGLFDPSVYPLVKGWGFMNNESSPLNQNEVDSLLEFVSFEEGRFHKMYFKNDIITILKTNPNFKLDFNAIAQGLSVDVVDQFLKGKGFENYYIEIGGEIIVRGLNRDKDKWRIGIDVPKENLKSRELENIIQIQNRAIATSGNYRKFYVKNGIKYSHTLNPKTGFPVEHSLLSATVLADDCATADGYATAFMVMGKDEALRFVKSHPEEKLEVYLIFSDNDGKIKHVASYGFTDYISN